MPTYVPGKLVLRKTWQPMDSDAAAYITAVEAADTAAGQSGGLEEKTKIAIDNFVLGCKADGIWSAIKASCILAGAKSLQGALVPLVGVAPTNFNFAAGTYSGSNYTTGDYNRKTGLVGDGSTKYLNSNRSGNIDPQNSHHISVYGSNFDINKSFVGSYGSASLRNGILFYSASSTNFVFTNRTSFAGATTSSITGQTTFLGSSRASSSIVQGRSLKTNYSVSANSGAPDNFNYYVFALNDNNVTVIYSSARLAFYSIGESLDLALLDARVTDLINAIGAAIP